eukprot:SAG31_NODE_2083_length_6490_cov_21.969645_3_plen_68_part_00
MCTVTSLRVCFRAGENYTGYFYPFVRVCSPARLCPTCMLLIDSDGVAGVGRSADTWGMPTRELGQRY